MKAAQIDRLVWPAIYLGLASVALGLSLRHLGDPTLGWTFIFIGAALVVIGICLIWLRSCTSDDSS